MIAAAAGLKTGVNDSSPHPVSIPLTTTAESCSDWAEIFSVASFNYLKNIMFLLW
jgi:hypothetical protein